MMNALALLRVSARRGLVVVAALAATGCPDVNEDKPAKEGELGVGTFFYVCVGDSDPYCDAAGQAENFPTAIAVGGRFGLTYNPDRDMAMPTIRPGSDSIVVDGANMRVVSAGWSVVFATTGFGDVFDLLHISGRDIERIAVTTEDSEELARIDMEPGQTLSVFGQAQDSARSLLAGSVTYEWASDDETVFRVATADLDESVQIEAIGPGTANLTITSGEYTETVAVEVGGETATGSDDGTGGSDDSDSSGDDDSTDDGSGSGSDSGSGSGSDSGSGSGSGSDDGGGSDSGGSSTGGE